MTDRELELKVALLKRFLWLGLGGLVLLLICFTLSSFNDGERLVTIFTGWRRGGVAVGVLALIPFVIYAVLLSIWHWKARYKGEHSNLWGGILVVETSGWSKIVYLLRHVIPDAKGSGRYSRK